MFIIQLALQKESPILQTMTARGFYMSEAKDLEGEVGGSEFWEDEKYLLRCQPQKWWW